MIKRNAVNYNMVEWRSLVMCLLCFVNSASHSSNALCQVTSEVSKVNEDRFKSQIGRPCIRGRPKKHCSGQLQRKQQEAVRSCIDDSLDIAKFRAPKRKVSVCLICLEHFKMCILT